MDDVEAWRQRIWRAPDEELLALHDANYLGLGSSTTEEWEAVIHTAEDEIRRRGLNLT